MDELLKKIEIREDKLEDLCSLYGRVEYPSTMKSSVVQLSIELKNLNEFKFYNCGSDTISSLKPRIIGSKGKIVIKVYTVFGKA